MTHTTITGTGRRARTHIVQTRQRLSARLYRVTALCGRVTTGELGATSTLLAVTCPDCRLAAR